MPSSVDGDVLFEVVSMIRRLAASRTLFVMLSRSGFYPTHLPLARHRA